MKMPMITAGLTLWAGQVLAQTPVLTVYTYDSFTADWGPGPAVEARFEETCACDLQFVGAGDGVALLTRLILDGDRTEADVVLGLDSNLIARARDTGLFAQHGLDLPPLDVPVEWSDDTFVPFDWGYFAFVHRDGLQDPPESLSALADSEVSVVLQDPRSSTPGLGLVMWADAALEDPEAFWTAMSDNIVTVTPGWSEAYGLFLEGEADMVLSYTTSPAYHLIAEEDDGYAAAPFSDGHYLQIEVAGLVEGTDQPDLAQDFLAFMLTEGFQDAIPTTNWMYPAITPEAGLPQGFDTLIRPDAALWYEPAMAAERRDPAVAAWRAALSR